MDDKCENKNKYVVFFFWLLSTLTLVSLVMEFRSMVIFTWFNYVPVVLIILCGVFVVPHGSSICMRILALLLACGTAGLFFLLLLFINPREFQQEFVSPGGSKNLVIEYDIDSRPYLYLRYGIFLKSVDIPELQRSTMHRLSYQVEWLSEDEIVMHEVSGWKWATTPVHVHLN